MRKILVFIILLPLMQLQAQDKKFYVGTGVGYAFTLGEKFSNDVSGGLALQAAKLGYRFHQNWGVVTEFYWSSHNFSVEDQNDSDLKMRYFSAGPMFTTGLGGQFSLDIKPQLLFGLVGSTKFKPNPNANEVDVDFLSNIGFLLGSSVNFGNINAFQFSLNIDYAFSKTEEAKVNGVKLKLDEEGKQDVSLLTVGLGVRYNF